VFTTAVEFSSAVDKNLGSKVVKIDRNVISRKIDNNRTFWQYAFDEVYSNFRRIIYPHQLWWYNIITPRIKFCKI
jgi:hypothetical protein